MIRGVLTLLTSEVAARALQALAFVVLTRKVTVAEMGRFGFATSLLAYLLLLLLPALDLVAVRRAARRELPLRATVGSIIRLRLVLAAVAVLLTGAYGLLKQDWLLPILSLTTVATALNARWGLQAVEDTSRLGVASVLSQAAFLAGVIAAPPGSLGWIAAAQVSGEACAAGWCALALRPHLRPLTALPVSPEARRDLLSEAWPLQASLLLGVMMYNFDVLMLGWFGRGADIAFYLAAYRFVTVFSPLFAAVQTAVYPRLARAFPDFAGVGKTLWRGTAALGLGCACVAALLTVFGNTALALLYGDAYSGAHEILRLLVWVLPLQAVRTVLRQLALACQLHASDPWRVLAAVFVNVAADFILIPMHGALGAAWSTLAAEATLLLLFALAVRRRV